MRRWGRGSGKWLVLRNIKYRTGAATVAFTPSCRKTFPNNRTRLPLWLSMVAAEMGIKVIGRALVLFFFHHHSLTSVYEGRDAETGRGGLEQV